MPRDSEIAKLITQLQYLRLFFQFGYVQFIVLYIMILNEVYYNHIENELNDN